MIILKFLSVLMFYNRHYGRERKTRQGREDKKTKEGKGDRQVDSQTGITAIFRSGPEPLCHPPLTPTGPGSLLPQHSTLTLGSYCQFSHHLPLPHLKISEPLFACPILSPANSKKLSYCSSPYSAPSLFNS